MVVIFVHHVIIGCRGQAELRANCDKAIKICEASYKLVDSNMIPLKEIHAGFVKRDMVTLHATVASIFVAVKKFERSAYGCHLTVNVLPFKEERVERAAFVREFLGEGQGNG